jgi:glycosyltransferase involved in cell wall biosynthesis
MKILVVTFPNDLGSRTIETNLCRFLAPVCDMQHFRFAAQDSERIDQKIDHRRNLSRRFQDALRLRRAVRAAVREGRKILFYNLSPAMFAWGSWHGGEAYITMDWARKLLSPEARGLNAAINWIHRKVFLSCSGLLPMTDAMASCLAADYKVPENLIRRVPSLFDVEHFDPGEITSSDRIRILYVGGDVKRKGGDLLYEAFRSRLKNSCTLTMVTNADFAPCEGFTLRKGIRYGTSEHLAVMRGHDIFILPTHEDAGPQVIGEAAAAGLVVLTTRFALGAPHVVNHGVSGFISDSAEACIEDLIYLVGEPEKIRQMRVESLRHMRTHFTKEVIATAYLAAMMTCA